MKRNRTGVGRRNRRDRRVAAFACFAAVVAGSWWLVIRQPSAPPDPSKAPVSATAPARALPQLSDDELRAAVDYLLDAVHPERTENAYFPAFARQRLQWMVDEHAARRLEVSFLSETATEPLPDDVLMAAWRTEGKSTIIISKRRFEGFLREGGPTVPPFAQEQKNDFAIGLVHEILHLQNPAANPRDPELRVVEESRAWREVTLNVVRPLRAANHPMRQRFRDVDDAFRACGDQLPCPPLARLVRLRL